MKNVYIVYLLQEFDCVEERLFRKPKFICSDSNLSHGRYVYANSKEEAEEKYVERYGIGYKTWQDDFFHTYSFEREVVNIKNSACAKISNSFSLETLKKLMYADDFLEYCRDRMYPIEVVIQ